MTDQKLSELKRFLNRIPAVLVLSSGIQEDSFWWVKLEIDIESALAWNVVQELGFVLNYISIEESLPTVFKPVSPPPYLNGGPKEFLSWVIESTTKDVDPSLIAKTLEERLPSVDDLSKWANEP
jgi:hypothetical protein